MAQRNTKIEAPYPNVRIVTAASGEEVHFYWSKADGWVAPGQLSCAFIDQLRAAIIAGPITKGSR